MCLLQAMIVVISGKSTVKTDYKPIEKGHKQPKKPTH